VPGPSPARDLCLYLAHGPRREAFTAWLSRVQGHGYAAGHQLALALTEADGVATADTLVGLAETLGIIERAGWDPSVEFRFSGVGGRRLGRRADGRESGFETGGPAVTEVAAQDVRQPCGRIWEEH
jgi:hypothetical protein